MSVKRVDPRPEAAATLMERPTVRPVPAGQETSTEPELDRLLETISQSTVTLNGAMIAAVRVLAKEQAWCEALRLLVGVGGYQAAEIADALGVMRSTVTRWYNGETQPQSSQISTYFARLLRFMAETRPFDLQIDRDSLIRR